MSQLDKAKLRQYLTDYFSITDLRNLCFDMQIDHENFTEQGKSGIVREIITHIEHIGRIDELVTHCRKLRSNIDWNSIFQSEFNGYSVDNTRDIFDDHESIEVEKPIGPRNRTNNRSERHLPTNNLSILLLAAMLALVFFTLNVAEIPIASFLQNVKSILSNRINQSSNSLSWSQPDWTLTLDKVSFDSDQDLIHWTIRNDSNQDLEISSRFFDGFYAVDDSHRDVKLEEPQCFHDNVMGNCYELLKAGEIMNFSQKISFNKNDTSLKKIIITARNFARTSLSDWVISKKDNSSDEWIISREDYE